MIGSAEDMVLMLNLGWSLTEIAEHYAMPVAVVILMIRTHLQAERVMARLLASEQS
jgi:hypothetical protein